MHILLGGRHLASTIGIGDVPERRQLVERQRPIGQTQHAAVDLAERPSTVGTPLSIDIAAWMADSGTPAVCSMSERL